MNVAGKPADAIYAFLRSLPLFSSLDDRTIRTVTAACSLRRVQKGRVVFLIGDPADALYLVQSGKVVQYPGGLGELEIVIGDIRAGDFFGDMGILLDEPHVASAVAAEDTVLVIMPRGVFLSILKSHAGACLFLLKTYARWLIQGGEAQAVWTLQGAQGKLAYYLLTKKKEEQRGGHIAVTQDEIALNCGVARQTVTRTFSEWRKAGWVTTSRGRIVAVNEAALAAVVARARSETK